MQHPSCFAQTLPAMWQNHLLKQFNKRDVVDLTKGVNAGVFMPSGNQRQ
jgi:hypothetical protein